MTLTGYPSLDLSTVVANWLCHESNSCPLREVTTSCTVHSCGALLPERFEGVFFVDKHNVRVCTPDTCGGSSSKLMLTHFLAGNYRSYLQVCA